MKRFLVVVLCALCAFACGGCTLLNASSSQEETVHVYYLETEDIDDSYALGMYFNFPARFCNQYFTGDVATGDLYALVKTLAENTAYEMYGKVYGLPAARFTLNGTKGTLSQGTGSIRWQAQYVYSRDTGVEFLAQVVTEDAAARDLYLAAADGFAYGFVPSWGERQGYTESQAYYRIYEGYRYTNPWTKALPEWKRSYEGEGAMSALWYGDADADVKGLGAYVNAAAFSRMNEILLTAYQFTSWHFNGCNGYYSKNPGTRTCSWGSKLNGSLSMPSVYRRTPKMWAWYLTGFGVVILFGVALYFGLKSGRKTMERMHAQTPPPQTPPPDPFGGDYGSASPPPPQNENPFGPDYN